MPRHDVFKETSERASERKTNERASKQASESERVQASERARASEQNEQNIERVSSCKVDVDADAGKFAEALLLSSYNSPEKNRLIYWFHMHSFILYMHMVHCVELCRK